VSSESPAAVIVDSAGIEVAVKGASTTPVAADKALVVAVSPNTPVLPVSGPLTDTQLRAAAVPVSHAAASQADGHSASIGATTDADTTNTLIGRLKKLISLVPAALVGGRFDVNIGAAPATLTQIDSVHAKVHAGKHFFINDVVALSGAGTVFDLLLTTDAASATHMLWTFAADSAFTLNVYEGSTTSAAGTSLSSHNSSRDSATAATLAVSSGPTVTAIGTQIAKHLMSTAAKAGGDVSRENELILKLNTKYILRFTKVDSGAGNLEIDLNWYEV
jgi:hypothetical protein